MQIPILFLRLSICVMLVCVSERGRVEAQVVIQELKSLDMKDYMIESYNQAFAKIRRDFPWLTFDEIKPGGNCKLTLYPCAVPRKQLISKRAGPLNVRLCCKNDKSTFMKKALNFVRRSSKS